MTDDKRMHYRFGGNESFFVEYRQEGPDAAPKMLLCHSADLSANGIKVRIAKDLPIDAIYTISVETDSLQAPLTLAGQVRWQTKIPGSDDFYYGIELLDSDGTDIVKWKLYVAQQLLKTDHLFD